MLITVIKAIIFLILLALGGYFFVLFQKKGWFFPQKVGGQCLKRDDLNITGRLSIGGRHYIAVVQCNERKFLIGVSPNSMISMGELKSSCETESLTSVSLTQNIGEQRQQKSAAQGYDSI
ncbi:MAG: flagellar biosynthetic protein FliO [Puniceicoccales bacterium]|jgi:flagellar biogenesis protein FliO|nr:flagellar biosynthetic protein FliO [Puniceicoccales bacterium]